MEQRKLVPLSFVGQVADIYVMEGSRVPQIVILQESVFDDGGFCPAASVNICGGPAVLRLRDALNEMFPQE